MIYDLMPVTLADYPGKVAATVFVSGCNFRCPYCHNSSLIKVQPPRRTANDILDYLSHRRHLLDGICITGGEPTLWDGLKDFIVSVKSEGLAVKLDTNGSRPDVLADLLNKGFLDYIAIDIKAPLTKYGDFVVLQEDIFNVKKSINIIMGSDIEYEFRTTVNQNLMRAEDFIDIANCIAGARKYVLQPYKYSDGVLNKYICGTKPCDPDFLKQAKADIINLLPSTVIRG
jgi:pyruvate formate lyase activating enzyme